MTPKRLLNWSLWLIVLGLVVPAYLRFALDDPVDYPGGGLGAVDFGVYYVAARMLVAHQDIYDYDLQARQYLDMGLPRNEGIYAYPSALAIAVTPLAGLSFENATRVWNLINLLLLALSLWLISRTLNLFNLLGVFYPLSIILFALAQPTLWSFRAGQSNIWLLFLLSLAFWALHRDNDWLAGMAVGTAGMIKLFPLGLLLLFVFHRRMRATGAGVITAAGILGASQVYLFLTGSDVTTDLRYVTRVLPFLTRSNPYPYNECVNGLISYLELQPFWNSALVAVISLAILGLTLYVISGRQARDEILSFSSILISFLLVASVTEASTLMLLVIPFSVLVTICLVQPKPLALAILLGSSYLALNSILVLSANGQLGIPFVTFLPLAGTILLWLAIIGQRQSVEFRSGQSASERMGTQALIGES